MRRLLLVTLVGLALTGATWGAERTGSHLALPPGPLGKQLSEAVEQEDWSRVLRLVQSAPSAGEVDARLGLLRGEALSHLEQYAEAEAAFASLDVSALDPEQGIHVAFRRAELALFRQDFSRAQTRLDAFRRDHAAHPLGRYVLPYLARAHAAQEHLEEARTLYAAAIRAYPDGPLTQDCQLRLALLDYAEGRVSQARQALRSLLDTSPGELREEATYWLGMAELRCGAFSAASQQLDAFTAAFPEHRHRWAAEYYAADAQQRAGQHQSALTRFARLRAEGAASPYAAAAALGQMECLAALGDEQALVVLAQESASVKATQILARFHLSRDRFQAALALLSPFLEAPSPAAPEARETHYQTLLLAARAHRELEQPNRASELLGRIRLSLCSPELAGQVQLARLHAARASGDLDRALAIGQAAEQALAAGKGRDAVRAANVGLLIQLGKLAAAKTQFLRMQQEATTQSALVRAAGELGDATYRVGDLVNARRCYDTMMRWHQTDTDFEQALLGLAWIDVKEQKFADAMARFETFLRQTEHRHASRPRVQLMLAQCLIQEGKREDGIAVLSDLAADVTTPLRAEALYRLATLWQAQPGNAPQARRALETLLDEFPTYDRRDAAWYTLAQLNQNVDPAKARTCLHHIARDHVESPYWSDALYRLAELDAAQDAPQSAQRYLTRLIREERSPRVLPHALYLRGKLHSKQKDFAAAQRAFTELLQAHPHSALAPLARFGLGEVHFQQGSWEAARADFEAAGAGFPEDSPWQALVQLRRAQLQLKREQFRAAAELARSLLAQEAFPLLHEVHYVLGRAMAGRGEFSAARKHYEQVLQSDPTYSREATSMAQWMIGETYLHQKQPGRAAKAFEAVIDHSPFAKWRALGLYQAARSYELDGKSTLARSTYKRLQDQYPESPLAAEAEHRIRVLDQGDHEQHDVSLAVEKP